MILGAMNITHWPILATFVVVRPPVFWPREWSKYPSRSWNGLDEPKGLKFKKEHHLGGPL